MDLRVVENRTFRLGQAQGQIGCQLGFRDDQGNCPEAADASTARPRFRQVRGGSGRDRDRRPGRRGTADLNLACQVGEGYREADAANLPTPNFDGICAT
jgi:hypothetical protein